MVGLRGRVVVMKVTGEVSQTRGKENSLHTCLVGD